MEVEAAAAVAFINVSIENVINVSNKEVSPIPLLHKNAEMLSWTLKMIQTFLYDAEKKMISHEGIKDWVKKLGAVVLDADNVVDEFKYYLLSQGTNTSKPPTKQAKIFKYFSSCVYGSEKRLTLRINEMYEKLVWIEKGASDFGLAPGLVNVLTRASEETDSYPANCAFYRRDDDDDVLKLADLLITNTTQQEEQVLSVLAILGMAGIGKTTLAKKLFNHESIRNQFDLHIWLHVGQAFDPIILLAKILAALTYVRAESRIDTLERLQQALTGRTCLLVLDDVWVHEERFDNFLNSLSGVISTKGNAFIITTRDRDVADMVRPFHIYQPNFLSHEECWSIIKSITFGNLEVASDFETTGRKIAQRCGALPLTAYLVGGILRGKSKEHWVSIMEELHSKNEWQCISTILILSFQNLSPSLRTCFVYCSIFPKYRKILKHELIELWMGEGFLQPNVGDDMESVGETFSNVLLQNSMLQVGWRDENGNVKSFVMHNLMHDLASSVSGSLDNADGLISVRYLTLIEESSPIKKEVAKHIRTIFLEGEISDDMLDYPSLRNLTLSRVTELPTSIRKMIHLRNLNLSESWITQLPDWIGELYNLQTLRAESHHLWKLPSTLKYLINLRHLYILSHVELPAEMGRLTNLRTLKHFVVGKNKGHQIEELKSLNNLKGKIRISSLENVCNKEEAAKANIHQKQNLSELVFRWSEEREGEEGIHESVLEGLEPHPNLEKLKIKGFKGKRFPSWAQKMEVRDGSQSSWVPLNNLIHITLSSCSECEEIPTLENLPNLKYLSLIGLKKVKFMNSSATNLLSLYICGLDILESLPDSLFHKNPDLSKLEIIGCPKLEELPVGLENLNSLVELNIEECESIKIIGNPCDGGLYSKGILRVVRIVDCGKLTEIPCQMAESWRQSLEILVLFELGGLQNLSMVIGCLAKSSRLRELEIGCVPQFMNTCSVESWHFGSLQKLHLDVSGESSVFIEEKVNGILQGCCRSLKRLCLLGNESWEWVPKSIQHLIALSTLELQNFGIEELPKWFGNLLSLSHLSLSGCSKLKYLLSWEALEGLTKLRHLDIKDCPQLQIGIAWRSSPNLTIAVDYRMIEPSTIETVDGDMTYAVDEVLINSLCNNFKEEYSAIGDVKQLQTTLGTIQSYFNEETHNKYLRDKAVKFLLKELQAMLFNADNVLDELNYHLLRNKLKKPKGKDKFLPCFSSFNHIARKPNMVSKIKQINIKFNSMIERAQQLGVESKIVTEPAVADAVASFDSFTPDPIFIGRDVDVQILVEKVIQCPEETTFFILAIVGMGGLGKTELAREVFNHEDIKAQFGSVWVHIYQTFDPVMLLKQILSALTSEAYISELETDGSILKKLQQALKAKTYILVLDDVWIDDVAEWKKFIDLISGVTSTKGNAIIITTRSRKVAELVKPLYTHCLDGLSDENCWSIIKTKSFQNGDVPSGQEVVGRQIAKRCQGLPIAANVLGGMLSYYKSEDEWLFVKKMLSGGEGDYNISKILKLSFDRLPTSNLKMCFAYCSVFPKGWKIVKEELIKLWMAEGFLQPNEGDDMESMGEIFSNVLLHSSLIQVAEEDGYGNVLSFVMHDLVHDLARSVFWSNTTEVLYMFLLKDHSSLIPRGKAKSLRTLIFQGEILDTAMFSSYKSLHALRLDCDQVKELPSSIRELIHLRNLNVSRTRIEYLPDWISELYYLQTINASTESLRKLPSTLKYLISLRNLYLCHDVELPAEIRRLTNLQALKFRVGERKGYRIEELRSLNNLKQLNIYNLEKVCDKEEAQEANISGKQNLTELSFEWDANIEGEREHDEAVLEGLEPHTGVKMLKIAGFKGKSFPLWAQKLIGFDRLIEITLSGCQGCEEIPELGQLPNLKILSLWRLNNVTSINSSFYGNIEGVSFPALETLLLTSMAELKVIQDFGDKLKVFPRLVSLKIYCCNKLESLPSCLFLEARGLKEVDMRHCFKLSRLPDDLHTLDSLELMTIKGCQNMKSIVKPESGGTFKSLRSLEIHDCQKLMEMVEPHAPLLKKVSMVELKSIQNLPKFLDSLEHSPSLEQLTIVGVPKFISSIKSLPFRKLRKLEIDVSMGWSSETSAAIKETVDSILQKCCSSLIELKLTGLEIWNVPEFEVWDVPESIKQLTSLYSLELENFGVNKLPKWFEDLSYLKRLCLSNFPNLRHLPSMKHLTELQEFHICNCPYIKIEYEGHKIFHCCAIYVNSHPL